MKWKKVNEELPSHNEEVFVLINNKVPFNAKFVRDIKMFCNDGLEVENVTHWLPIPSVQKEEKLELEKTLKSTY